MKFRFTCSSWSNIRFKREEIVDIDISAEEWLEDPHGCSGDVEEQLRDWINTDLSFDANIVEEDLAAMGELDVQKQVEYAKARKELGKIVKELVDNPENKV